MPTATPPAPISRLQRILAYMIGAIILVSVICIIAILVGSAVGVGANDGFSGGIWPLVIVLPFPGLIVGFLLMIALLVITAINRSRAAKDAGH